MDRRTFITTAAATPLAGAAVAEPYDPLPELVGEWQRRKGIADASSDDDVDRLTDWAGDIERSICLSKPQSREGLQAQAEYLRYELTMGGVGGLSREECQIVDHFFDALTEQLAT